MLVPLALLLGCGATPLDDALPAHASAPDAPTHRVVTGEAVTGGATTATYDGDLVLETADDIDSFCDSYDSITGSIRLSGPDLPDEIDLSCLVEVGRHLVYENDDYTGVLKTIDLSSLTRVGWDLRLYEVYVDAVELPVLEEVGGSLVLDSAYLGGTVSLPALAEVRHTLRVDLHVAEEIELPALTRAGLLELRGSVNMLAFAAPELVELRSLWLVTSDDFDDIDLSALRTVREDVDVYVNDTLDALALPALEEVGGDLEIIGTESTITEVDLSALERVDGDLIIGEDSTSTLVVRQIDRLDLGALRRVEGRLDLYVTGIGEVDVSALEQLDSVTRLWLGGGVTHELDQLFGVGDSLPLNAAASGASVVLTELRSTPGGVSFYGFDTAAAPELVELGSSLSLRYLYDQVDLDGFSAVRTVGGELRIDDNPVLEDLGGLHGVEEVGANLEVTDNDMLTDAEVDALVAAIGEVNIAGEIDLSGNGGAL